MKKVFFYFLLFSVFVINAQIAERPLPERLYNNLSKEFPDFLNPDEAEALEEKLERFSNETSNQICVVIVDDLNGMDASSYAIKLGNEWGVGNKKFNNGIVILIKPTGGNGQRDLFIAVGYGLEGAIPDLATKKIREEEMNPYMREGNFYQALDGATTVLMKLAKGEINIKDYEREEHNNISTALILFIVIGIMLLRLFFRGGGGRTFRRGGSNIYWGGGFGGWGGGSGFSGGGGGGGWGGFGGGSFGGGGSGGKW